MNNNTAQVLAEQRKRLKIRLWQERKDECMTWPFYTRRPDLARALCVWCKATISMPDDCTMHEWLLKRSDVPRSLQTKIMHEYNCVLAHVLCHDQHGQTREFKMRCADAQYKRYGRNTIAAWVKGLGLKQHVEIPEERNER